MDPFTIWRPARTCQKQLLSDTGFTLNVLLIAMDDKDGWREKIKEIRCSQCDRIIMTFYEFFMSVFAGPISFEYEWQQKSPEHFSVIYLSFKLDGLHYSTDFKPSSLHSKYTKDRYHKCFWFMQVQFDSKVKIHHFTQFPLNQFFYLICCIIVSSKLSFRLHYYVICP